MKGFKEWISDYLRYFMLILTAVLLFGIVYIGIRVYQNYDSPTAGENIEILTEEGSVTEKETESESEKATESESEPEKVTEPESGKASETPAGAQSETQPQTVETLPSETQPRTAETLPTEPQTAEVLQTETQPPTEAQTQPPTEPEPVYRTMTGACNFRSGPGYEYEVMAEYPAGTVVEFLGIVEGWCEVRIDGVTGYMGQRFFE